MSLVFYWWFRRIVKTLIPFVFLGIAIGAGKNEMWGLEVLSGTMFIAVVLKYVFEWQKIGE